MKGISKTTFAISLAALSMSAAQAIDKSSPKLLMDNGFGSEATDGWTDYSGFDPDLLIVGSKNDFMGRPQPACWSVNPVTDIIEDIPIPSIGFPGRCLAGRRMPDGSEVAVGNLIMPSGDARAVVWRRITANDDWEAPVAFAPGTTIDAQGQITGDTQADAPGSILQEGRRLPVVFLKVNVDIAHTLLPVPPNAQGQALSIGGSPGARVVGGWVQMPGGLRKPVIWEQNGSSWTLTPVQVGQDMAGQVNSLILTLPQTSVAGQLSRNSRTLGFFAYDPSGSLTSLRPLDGFRNSTAYNLGDTGTHEVGHIIFGGSFNGSGNPLATCWIDQNPYRVQQLLTDPSSVNRILGFHWGVGRSALGNVLQSAGALRQACAFVPSGVQAPDRLNILVGRGIGKGEPDLSAMWHADGEMTGVRTEMVNGQQMACVDIDFTPLSFTAGQDARMDAKIMVPNQVTGATINVYFLNHSSQEFEQIYSANPGGGLLGISAPLPAAAQSSTGMVRLRIEFRPNGNQPRTIGIDTIEVVREG